jgi:hypothetical protein
VLRLLYVRVGVLWYTLLYVQPEVSARCWMLAPYSCRHSLIEQGDAL